MSKTKNDTGLGLIGATVERVKNEKSQFRWAMRKLVNNSERASKQYTDLELISVVAENLLSKNLIFEGGFKGLVETTFSSDLKKLLNSTEKQIWDYLKKPDFFSQSSILKRIDKEDRPLKIRALDGSNLLYKCELLRFSRNQFGLGNVGISTPETILRVDEATEGGSVKEIIESLPGIWNQKWLSQNQITETHATLIDWYAPIDKNTLFICKNIENLPVDEYNPAQNLTAITIVPREKNNCRSRSNVYWVPFDSFHIHLSGPIRIISPL